MYDFSVKVFLHEINKPNEPISVANERDQGGAQRIIKQKSDIKANKALMDKAYRVNNYDMELYKLGDLCFLL